MYCTEIITIWTYVVHKCYSKFVKIGIIVRSLNFFKWYLILHYIYIYIYIIYIYVYMYIYIYILYIRIIRIIDYILFIIYIYYK